MVNNQDESSEQKHQPQQGKFLSEADTYQRKYGEGIEVSSGM